jgi:hypothetical protein
MSVEGERGNRVQWHLLKVSSTASGEDVFVGIKVIRQNAWMSIKIKGISLKRVPCKEEKQ